MKVLISSEHAGFHMKMDLARLLTELGFEVVVHGAQSADPVDYPPIIEEATGMVVTQDDVIGIFICGTGLGVSIAASKIPGATVALCNNIYTARMAREHNNANILCLGSRVLGFDYATDIVKTFLASSFNGDRHIRRINQVIEIERRYRIALNEL